MPGEQASALTEWLHDETLAARATELLMSGTRVPQEAVTLTALTCDHNWLDGL